LRTLVLGSGELKEHRDSIGRVTTVDIRDADIVWDLNEVEEGWPIEGGWDRIIAEHILEHLNDPISFLRECHRLLIPGGLLIVEVPNWRHINSVTSLEHKRAFSRLSFTPAYYSAPWTIRAIEYHIAYPFTDWKYWRTRQGWMGRLFDRYTRKVVNLRFYLRKI